MDGNWTNWFQIKQMITEAAGQYVAMTMIKELQYMEETLPGLLDDVKTIQQKVDNRHSYKQ